MSSGFSDEQRQTAASQNVAAQIISTDSVASHMCTAGDRMCRHVPARIHDTYANNFQAFEAEDFSDIFPAEHRAFRNVTLDWNTSKKAREIQLHLYCTQNLDYTDTLTDQDT